MSPQELADACEESSWQWNHYQGNTTFYKKYLQEYFDLQSALLEACGGDTKKARTELAAAYMKKRFGLK